MLELPFRDRTEAGRLLGAQLADRKLPPDSIVLRCREAGFRLDLKCASAGLPLDVIVVRKLGVPWQPELAMGAIASGGVRVLDEELIRQERISRKDVEAMQRATWVSARTTLPCAAAWSYGIAPLFW